MLAYGVGDKRRAARRRYKASEKGRAAQERYRLSDKGRRTERRRILAAATRHRAARIAAYKALPKHPLDKLIASPIKRRPVTTTSAPWSLSLRPRAPVSDRQQTRGQRSGGARIFNPTNTEVHDRLP